MSKSIPPTVSKPSMYLLGGHTSGNSKVLRALAVRGKEDVPDAFGADVACQDWFPAIQKLEA